MRKRGFTLIELLAVIAIIGILASIIAVSLVSGEKKGRDAKRIGDIKQIQESLDQYFNDNPGSYPPDIYNPTKGFAGKYMSVVPTDPSYPGVNCDYSNGGNPANTGCYFYSALRLGSLQTCSYYHLGAQLEDNTNTALGQDSDLAYNAYPTCVTSQNASNFGGNSATCTYGSSGSGTDACYDVTPQ